MLKAEFPYLEVRGFDDRDVDIRSVREFAEAIYDMLTDHPNVALTTVSITKPPPGMSNAYAWCTPAPTGKGYLSAAISLNADLAADWPAYCQAAQDELDTGWAFSRPDKPVYSTIIHEFGHVMDFATHETAHEKQAAHEKTKQVLHEVHRRTAPDVDYDTWVREQLSAYSFLDPNKEDREVEPSEVHPYEVLAEAFTDATLNGNNARETSKALHKLMVDSVNTARGK